MHALGIHILYLCVFHRWPYEESASHTCRVRAHRQRPHAIARVRRNTHAFPFTCPDKRMRVRACMYMFVVLYGHINSHMRLMR
jgi:hypothetical protein